MNWLAVYKSVCVGVPCVQAFIRRAPGSQHMVLLTADVCHPARQTRAAGSVGGGDPGADCWLLTSPVGATQSWLSLQRSSFLPGAHGFHWGQVSGTLCPPGFQVPEGKPVFPENVVQGASAGWHGAPALLQRDRLQSHVLDASQGSALQPGPSRTRSAGPALPARC